MKKTDLLFMSLLAMAFTLAGCGKNEQQPGEKPTAPVDLEFTPQYVDISKASPVAYVHITDGNGDYRIVLPKQIQIGWYTEDPQFVDFSDEILTLQLEGTQADGNIKVRVEYKLPDAQFIEGFFMVVDGKDRKRIFVVSGPAYGGITEDAITPRYDLEEIESRLLNDPDYWQE